MTWKSMDTKNAPAILLEVKEILDNNNIPFWLYLGTLLGVVRDGKIIENDTDIDIATWIMYEEKVKKLTSLFIEKGFSVSFHIDGVSLTKNNVPVSFGFFEKNEINNVATLKFCFYFNKNIVTKAMFYLILNAKSGSFVSKMPFKTIIYNLSYFFYRLSGAFGITAVIPLEYILPLKKIQFHSKTFSVPNNKEECLRYLYGDDWKTPKQCFNISSDSKYPYSHFKGTFYKILVSCKHCHKEQVIDNPHKKDDNLPEVINHQITCKYCKHKWYEKVFVLGTIVRRFRFT